jgi:DNA-binding PadR family transcriptional regulator
VFGTCFCHLFSGDRNLIQNNFTPKKSQGIKKTLDRLFITQYICITQHFEVTQYVSVETEEVDAMVVDISPFATEMNRGFLQVLVLVLLEKNMYGYAMVKRLEEKEYTLEENTLYPLLRRLEKKGLIKGKWDVSKDRPRKFYAITAEGRNVRAQLLKIWQKQNDILNHIIEENKNV